MSKILSQNKDFSIAIRLEIVEVLREILNDPDFGLELTDYAKKRLRKALKSKGRGIPFSEIKRKYYRNARLGFKV